MLVENVIPPDCYCPVRDKMLVETPGVLNVGFECNSVFADFAVNFAEYSGEIEPTA